MPGVDQWRKGAQLLVCHWSRLEGVASLGKKWSLQLLIFQCITSYCVFLRFNLKPSACEHSLLDKGLQWTSGCRCIGAARMRLHFKPSEIRSACNCSACCLYRKRRRAA